VGRCVTDALVEPATPNGAWSPALRLLTAGLLLTVTLVGAEALAISAVMPNVAFELGDRWLYGWVFSAFFLGDLVGITLAGHFADRMHPWRPFALGLVLFSAGLLAGGLAPSMPVLVAARVAQGLGAGALPATAYVCIARAWPQALRPRMFALLATAWVVPGLLGPSAAVFVSAHLGWRWVFLGLLPLVVVFGALAVYAVRARVPPTAPQPQDHTVARDAVLIAVGAGVAVAGLTSSGWPLLVAGILVGTLVGLPPYLRLTPKGTLRARPGLPTAIACRGLLAGAFFAADAFVSLALVDGRGAPGWVVGVTLSSATVLWTVGAWVQERTIQRFGPRALVLFGFSLLAALWAVAAAAMWWDAPVLVLVLAFGLAGVAMGPAYAAISVTTLGLATRGAEGKTTIALQLTDVLGIALGTGVVGAWLALGERMAWPLSPVLAGAFAGAAAIAVVGALATRGLPRELPPQAA
jgi:MFS family permease